MTVQIATADDASGARNPIKDEVDGPHLPTSKRSCNPHDDTMLIVDWSLDSFINWKRFTQSEESLSAVVDILHAIITLVCNRSNS